MTPYLRFPDIVASFQPASDEFTAIYPHAWNPEYHGTNGPVQTTVPHNVHTIDHMFQDTLVAKGVKYIKDPYGGDVSEYAAVCPKKTALLLEFTDYRVLAG